MNVQNPNPKIEKPTLRLGLVPLIDAAPLVVALEKGYFARHALDVELSLENSWASIRDKVALGLLDAATMPAPMPIAASLGIDAFKVPMTTAISLNLNGNAITLSTAMTRRLSPYLSNDPGPREYARALKRVLEQNRVTSRPRAMFAHVFPYSKHHYELRIWLESGGIDCDNDVTFTVVPPQLMVERLESAAIDGFCVGAPWGEVARQRGTGTTVATSYELWNNGPEKVLGVTQDWAQRHPITHRALVAALIEACRWLDEPDHRKQAGHLMLDLGYVSAPAGAVMSALELDSGQNPLLSGGLVFHAGAANFPWRSHAQWFAGQMRASGQLPASQDIEEALKQTYRCDLFRQAAQWVNEPCPLQDDKPENLHDDLWRLPSDRGEISLGPDRYLSGVG